MPRPNKQNIHLKQIRNIKKMNSDNKLNKNLEYTSGETQIKKLIMISFMRLTILVMNGLMKPYLKNWMMHLLD